MLPDDTDEVDDVEDATCREEPDETGGVVAAALIAAATSIWTADRIVARIEPKFSCVEGPAAGVDVGVTVPEVELSRSPSVEAPSETGGSGADILLTERIALMREGDQTL